jgi:hypothetical protein
MARKTVDLVTMIVKVNERNKLSTCAPDVRRGWNDLLETLLLENGVYAGFSYLSKSDVPAGHAPGILAERRGDDFTVEQRFEGCDETRRHYHFHNHLKAH